MAAFHEQRLADMAAILADPNGPAIEVVIGVTQIRVIPDQPSLVHDDMGRPMIERHGLLGLRADLGFSPVPGMELVIDGVNWVVESAPPGDVLDLRLMRYRS